jgi:hypothetical protein
MVDKTTFTGTITAYEEDNKCIFVDNAELPLALADNVLSYWKQTGFNPVGKKFTLTVDADQDLCTFAKPIGQSQSPLNTPSEQKKPVQSKGSFMDDYIGHEELIAKAKEAGILYIQTALVSDDGKRAVMKCDVMNKEGIVFTDYGDAGQDSITSSSIKPHYLRMASTRAINRALRLALFEGKTTKEELSDGGQ